MAAHRVMVSWTVANLGGAGAAAPQLADVSIGTEEARGRGGGEGR